MLKTAPILQSNLAIVDLAILKRPDGLFLLHTCILPGYSEIIAIMKGSVGFMHFTIARFDCIKLLVSMRVRGQLEGRNKPLMCFLGKAVQVPNSHKRFCLSFSPPNKVFRLYRQSCLQVPQDIVCPFIITNLSFFRVIPSGMLTFIFILSLFAFPGA